MSFDYLSNSPLEAAVAELLARLDQAGMAPQPERVASTEALGRVSAQAVYAHISAPHYHACAMDGIAVQAADTFGATATTPVVLQADQYLVVDTGDPLPEGTDAVVMIEDVIADAPNGQLPKQGGCPVKLLAAVAPWGNVRQIGEDICAGEMLLTSNTVIEPAAIGALLAAGVVELDVVAKPKVGIIPTGDEVVPPSANPKPGDVMEFNSSIFSGMVARYGGIPVTYDIVEDTLEAITAALEKALEECDVVLLNAGSSAGRDDYASEAIAAVGEIVCHGLSIKPGKPAILAHRDAQPIIGVPGYPVSGIIVVEQVLAPIMARLAGRAAPAVQHLDAVLSQQIVSSLKHQEFVRVRLGVVDGKTVASPLPRGAGVVTSFMKADGLLSIPQDSEGLEAGSPVSVRLLRAPADIRNSLVVIGSHDPLLDEVAELVHRIDPNLFVSSSHVGSMGAIMAAKRHENHCGGIHLLDEATGTYNETYLKKHFPAGGVRQVECVYRKQGLMVAAGNPKGIGSLADLAKPGLSFVNRQKGSGTRILSDYICSQEGIDPSQIYGYDHEEFTHTAVAALVESGSVDAGMGIYSAAKIYGLDFVEVCEEQYDLLVPDYAWDTPVVQTLIAVLSSAEFRERIENLGGYRLDAPGTVRRHYKEDA